MRKIVKAISHWFKTQDFQEKIVYAVLTVTLPLVYGGFCVYHSLSMIWYLVIGLLHIPITIVLLAIVSFNKNLENKANTQSFKSMIHSVNKYQRARSKKWNEFRINLKSANTPEELMNIIDECRSFKKKDLMDSILEDLCSKYLKERCEILEIRSTVEDVVFSASLMKVIKVGGGYELPVISYYGPQDKRRVVKRVKNLTEEPDLEDVEKNLSNANCAAGRLISYPNKVITVDIIEDRKLDVYERLYRELDTSPTWIRSLICIPIVPEGSEELIGILNIQSNTDFFKKDERWQRKLVSSISIFLDIIRVTFQVENTMGVEKETLIRMFSNGG